VVECGAQFCPDPAIDREGAKEPNGAANKATDAISQRVDDPSASKTSKLSGMGILPMRVLPSMGKMPMLRFSAKPAGSPGPLKEVSHLPGDW